MIKMTGRKTRKSEPKDKAYCRETHKAPFSAADAERAERLRQVLDALAEINKLVPVVVEGRRDAAALKALGLEGEIITLHNGAGMYEFSEALTRRYEKVVLLLDWDDKGDTLTGKLGEELGGHYEEFSFFRNVLRILCQKDIKDIEAIPSLLRRLEGGAGHGQQG